MKGEGWVLWTKTLFEFGFKLFGVQAVSKKVYAILSYAEMSQGGSMSASFNDKRSKNNLSGKDKLKASFNKVQNPSSQ